MADEYTPITIDKGWKVCSICSKEFKTKASQWHMRETCSRECRGILLSRSTDFRKKMIDSHSKYKGVSLSLRTRLKISKKLKGHKVLTETKQKISKSLTGIPLSPERKQNVKEQTKIRMNSPEMRAKLSLIAFQRWKDKSYAEMMFAKRKVKPNGMEVIIMNILNELFPNEWKYCGDGTVWINGKNPDFINMNGKKMLVEFFGNYWHKKEDEEIRKNHFKKYGYKTIVVWESELKDRDSLKGRFLNA